MDIICEHCQARISIADHKVPKGKRASFLCPKCSHRIYISNDTCQNGVCSGSPRSMAGKERTNVYDSSDKPFDFLDENDMTMLVCMKDNDSTIIVEKLFNNVNYRLISVDSAETALRRMKYHIFDRVVVDEEFDENNNGSVIVLNYLNSLNMAIRRRIFAVLVSSKYRTMDNMAAFHISVNLILNRKDIKNMKKIFLRNIKDYERFYRTFNDALKTTGKI